MSRRSRAHSRRSGKRRSGKWRGRSWRRRLAAFVAFTLLVGLVVAGGAWSWIRAKGPPREPVAFQVHGEPRVQSLVSELVGAGLIDDPRVFSLYLRLTNRIASVRSGPHLLRRGLSPGALLGRLTRSGARPIVKFTIVEGQHRFQIADRLQAMDVALADAFLAATVDEPQLRQLGILASSAEGYLFPATYELYVDSDPSLLLRTFAAETFRRFQAIAARHSGELAERRAAAGWGVHEFVTLASIVEKEAADASEHGPVASVFYNRLKDASFRPRKMLQSDPTAGYGCLLTHAELQSCHGYAGIVTPAMLRDAANAYNTYKHPGLPPGPISNPSQSALEAVINPPQTPYFFFVKGASKHHVFSRTLSEHQHAIVTGVGPESSDPRARDAPPPE